MTIAEVVKTFHQIHGQMVKNTDEFPWEDKTAYISWLAQTMEYVTYGTRILSLTAGRFPLSQTELASRFIQHATEERGHEKLLINDAKALGANLAEIQVLPEAEAFHKSIYYWIYHDRPAVIMGWILFLEGFAIRCGPQAYQRVEKSYGTKGTSFLLVHTQEDPYHVEKALSVLNNFSSVELEDVAHGLKLYASLYRNIFFAIEKNVLGSEMRAG
jgi:hypothetical protein